MAEPATPPAGFMARLSEWHGRHPVLAIWLVALLAVTVNCYPIVFCSRSYVSPMSVNGWLGHDRWPPMPGMGSAPVSSEPAHGSDTEAEMWWGVPAGFIEARSILEHGEIPLWNRYSHAGDVFLGQAVSMLGDPLQCIVILGHGSALAWDIKFLAAKFLFCTGFGWLVLRLTGSRRLSLAYAALAAYCGAFFFIHNHPAFFVFSYAPWILLSAIELLDLNSSRAIRWGLVWLLANFACFNAGHVELAVVLIGGLNLAATINALTRCANAFNLATVLGRMGIATLLFLGLTSPLWLTFLVTLQNSHTSHDQVLVKQLPLSYLPRLFDDGFFLFHWPGAFLSSIVPGTSLLIFAGCGFSVLEWRRLKGDAFFWVNAGAIIAWAGCIFGWVPASVLARIPLLNRVGHNHVDFSYLLDIHLTIQSAYGFWCLKKIATLRQAAVDVAWIAVAFGGMVLWCSGGHNHGDELGVWNYFLCAGLGAIGAPLLYAYLKSRRQTIPAAGWVGIIILGFIPNFRFGLYTGAEANSLLLLLPGPRGELDIRSPAIDNLKAQETDPYRVVALGHELNGDYAAVYGLEEIHSCAPLWNGDYLDLIRNFPGMSFAGEWLIQVADPAKTRPLLNLLNVKYLLDNPAADKPAGLDWPVTARSDFLVLKNPDAWPRAFFSHRIIPIDSNAAFIRQLVANGRQPFVAMTGQAIEQTAGLLQLATQTNAEVTPATHYQLLPNSTAFDIHVPSSGVVCLTEGRSLDFTATANGESREVLTMNRAFKGIYLHKAGDYHIEFRYRPRYWTLACWLFWISAGAALLLAGWETMQQKKRTS